MNRFFKLFGAFLSTVILFACGGGGLDSLDATAPQGKVTLVLTDAPVDAFESVEITILSLTFIGSEGQVSVPLPDDQPVTVDLLQLDGLNMLFAQADIPVGRYSELRLEVSDPKLILEDGVLVPPEDVILLGDGKIDLLPEKPFLVEEGQELLIQLDFDMEKSLKIHETENGKYIIRPVVFVHIQDGSTPSLDMEDIVGVIQAINKEEMVFSLGVRRHLSVRVKVTEDTLITDSEGNTLDFDDLKPHQKVEVEGKLNHQGGFLAASIEIHGRFVHGHGVIKDLDLVKQEFILVRRGHLDQIVLFDESTLIHFGWEHLSEEDLANGQRVRVAGEVYSSSMILKAHKIRIKPEHFRGWVASTLNCPQSIQVVIPRAKLHRLRLAGIELVPENTITVQLRSDRIWDRDHKEILCSNLSEGDVVRVRARLIPHTPDDQDPNPIQLLAYHVQQVKQAHVLGNILSIHPDPLKPELGTFILGVEIPGIHWSIDEDAPIKIPIRILVNPHTTFEEGMNFEALMVGEQVLVKGYFSLRHSYPLFTLVAIHVSSATNVGLTNGE